MAAALSVELLSPEAPLGPRLVHDLDDARSVSMAVAFAKQSALDVVPLERWCGAGRSLRLLAGTDFALTELEVLRRIEPLAGAACKVYASRTANTTFHPKLYVLDKGRTRVAYVGSSNLTRGGMVGNVEANVRLEGPPEAPELRDATALFERLYASEFSMTLSPELEARYREVQEAERARVRSGWADGFRNEQTMRASELMLLGQYHARREGGRHWLLVVSPKNYAVCMKHSVWGRSKPGEVADYKPGDLFFFHVTRPVSGIRAMGMFTGAPSYDATPLWPDEQEGRGSYPHRVRFVQIGELRDWVSTETVLRSLRPDAPRHFINGFVAKSHELARGAFDALHEAFLCGLREEMQTYPPYPVS